VNPKKIAIGIITIAVVVAIIIFNVNKESEVAVDKAQSISYEYFVLYGNNDKVGVVDKTGKLLIDTEYTDIYIPNASKDVFLCYKDEDCTVLNKDGKKIYTDFEEVSYLETSEATELVLESEVLRYKKDNLYGLLSIDGDVLTDAIYEKVTSLKNKPGVLLVKQDGKYGVLDTKGNEIIPVKYDSIVGDEYCLQDYGYNLAGYIVSQKTDTGVMYGYIDYSGKVILNTEYETISRALEYEDINDLYLIVRNNGKKGVFKNGKQIIDFEYQSINYANKSNVFIVEKTGKYGFFTNSGKEILKPKYTKYGIAGNYISVQEGENTMLYDLNGNLINKDNYLSMIEVENSSYFIAVNESGFYSIISKDTQINEDYTYITYAFDNYFIFTNTENKTGVLDVWNGTVIEPQYDSIINVEGTKVLECRNAETGEVDIYNSQIDKVCTISDAIVEKIDENYIRAYSNSQMQYFDSTGKSVKNTEVFKDKKLYSYSQDEKWGFCDKEGKVVVEAEYDIVTEINDYGFAGIKKDGKWGIIDESGKIIVEPSYELETYYFPKFVGKYQLELIDTLHCVEI
jgi:hypothetical protein